MAFTLYSPSEEYYGSDGGVVCYTGGGGKTTSILRLAARLERNSTVIATTTTRMAESEVEPERVLLTKNFPSISSPTFLSTVKKVLKACGTVFVFRDISNGKYAGLSPRDISFLEALSLAPWVLVEADGALCKPLKGYAEHEPPLPGRFDCQVVVVGADAFNTPMNESTTGRFEILQRFLDVERHAVLTPPLLLRLLTSPDMYLKNSPPCVKRILCINKSDLMNPDALTPWVTYLRLHLLHYHGILVTGRDEENFYPMDR